MDGLAEALFGFIFIAFAVYFAVEILVCIFPYLLIAGLVALCGWVICAIFASREAIARWYYFTFHPHPAEPIVRASLAGRRLIAGGELAAVLGEVPADNRILREVRIKQGERLVAQMQQASAEMIRQTVKNAQADNARAAVLGIQEAIALAAIALERAKAAHSASKSTL